MIARLLLDRRFLSGLALKLILIVLVTPFVHLPDTFSDLLLGAQAPLMPGSPYPAGVGVPDPFDGGPLSLLVFDVFAQLGGVLGVASLGLILSVLVCDVGVYLVLAASAREERREEIAIAYWLSPLAIVLLYWQGAFAVLATLALTAALLQLDRRRHEVTGLLFGVAIVAQPVLVTILPIIVLYAFGFTRLRHGTTRRLLAPLAATLVVAVLIGWIDVGPGLLHFFSKQMLSMLGPIMALGGGGLIALLPLVLVGIYYAAWRTRLLNHDLLWTFVTLVLLAVVGLGGGSIDRSVLLVPFIVAHAAYAQRAGRALLALLSAAILTWSLLFVPGAAISGVSTGAPAALLLVPGVVDLFRIALLTAIAGAALAIAIQVVQRGLLRSPQFLASRRPIAVGVAGDSGVGKDTLIDAIGDLFGPRAIAKVSGDDYHNWDRNKPMWRALTHLNPKANDLMLFTNHVTDLIDRRWVRARHYDHTTGRMTKPLLLEPGEIVLASGLHALWSPIVNRLYDLRIFLDMDEDLRRFLKIRRDVHVRGHPIERVVATIARRHVDAITFIHPQKAEADLVFRLEPRRSDALAVAEDATDIPLRLIVEAVPGIVFDGLARVLVSLSGVQVVEYPEESGATRVLLEGDPSVADIAAAGKRIAPSLQDMLRADAEWQPGLVGVMQLIVLDQFEQIRRRRSVRA